MNGRLVLAIATAAGAVGLTALVFSLGDSGGARAPESSRGPGPEAEIRGCRERIEGPRLLTPQRGDVVIGPIAFGPLAQTYHDRAAHPESWEAIPRYGMPTMKIIAALRAGAGVTLVVPHGQRPWMKLIYERPDRGGTPAIGLQACQRFRSPRAQGRECGWRPYRACQSRYTNFSGGFALDFAKAPKRGLCAELIVWVKGQERPLRERLFRPRASECA
jgi:hypothetical protein